MIRLRKLSLIWETLGARLRGSYIDEWRRIRQDKSILMMLLFLPLLYAVTVSWLYGQESVVDCPIIIVDQDSSIKSRRLTWLMDATEEVRVVDNMTSVEDAFTRLRRHEAAAVVFIPEGFELRLLHDEQAKIKLWIDSANMLTYGTAYTGIRSAVSVLDDERMGEAFVAKGMTRRQANRRVSPIEVSERLLYHPTGSYGAFFAPAVFVVALQQAILLAFAVSSGARRACDVQRGMAPETYLQLLVRYLVHLPFHLLSVVSLTWLIHRLYPFAATNVWGVWLVLSIFTVVTGGAAILVSLPFSNGKTPLQVLMLISTPLFLASGYTWPDTLIPEWVNAIVSVVPSTPAISGVSIVGMKSTSLNAASSSIIMLVKLGLAYVGLGLVIVSLRSWLHSRRRSTRAVS
jgi:ABC-2 type transport system permease protein